MGGEELDAFLWCLFVWFNLTRDTSNVTILSAVFPSPPGPLLPTNSGLACLRWRIRSSEFAGRGGAIAFLLASLSEVSARRLPSQRSLRLLSTTY